MQQPVIVLNTNTERTQGRKAQLSNIQAAKSYRMYSSRYYRCLLC
ncbi:hypothetical protein BDEG_23347 [Batrachochytrium dendrobatidis JEL423]|uniref:Uncharacterized protein n=1 Tax=Batrachochytrium dendrobatidis (strain JEL423) TaxID=403673 RepID=A0A177WHB5_BATDL|nr:hypothetical protein BDEG_23347 [Batrachochytrium dendrobatidis JEL423]